MRTISLLAIISCLVLLVLLPVSAFELEPFRSSSASPKLMRFQQQLNAQQEVTIAPPTGDSKQVHVHVNVAAPKVVQSNAGLQAMVQRVAKKNQQAADKMDAILSKLKSQDCRGGNCIPATHKEMEQWKADWILETEETGSIVP